MFTVSEYRPPCCSDIDACIGCDSTCVFAEYTRTSARLRCMSISHSRLVFSMSNQRSFFFFSARDQEIFLSLRHCCHIFAMVRLLLRMNNRRSSDHRGANAEEGDLT